MGEIKADALRKQLKSGRLDRCYLLWGKEHYLQEHYSRELRKAVLGGEDDPFNLRRLDGKNLNLQDLADAVDAYPSFAEKALVELRDCDPFQLPEEEWKRLSAILEDLPEYCCLVFLYDTVEFKPDKRKKKLWEQLNQLTTLVEFPLQEQNELIRWVQKHFSARGKEIETEDAAYLLFLCGSQMDNLTNEIGKVAVYASDRRVSREDIDAVAVPIVEAQTFKLTDALARKEFDQAAELMYKLFQLNTEPTVINAMIGSQLRKLYAARLVKEAGGNASALTEMTGGSSDYVSRQNLRICTAFPEAWYLRMIRLSAETDLRMKTSQGDPEDLLRSLFVTMAAEA
ncbi:MAG: DNA polymerase III subunit delta [Oscillospiraceae bacterium]|nr:DNA polymerase III subunit delta [Oscillospiraceae bacterium]